MAQAAPETRFGKTIAVMRRRIKNPDPARNRLLHRRNRRLLVELCIQIANRRGAEPDSGEIHPRAVPRSKMPDLHASLPEN